MGGARMDAGGRGEQGAPNQGGGGGGEYTTPHTFSPPARTLPCKGEGFNNLLRQQPVRTAAAGQGFQRASEFNGMLNHQFTPGCCQRKSNTARLYSFYIDFRYRIQRA